MMRLIFAGPCSVGKTTIAQLLSTHLEQVVHLDLDVIRLSDTAKRNPQISPCSVTFLDLRKCLPPILDVHLSGFILDIGGGTIFRRNADNEGRLQQVYWLKEFYRIYIVVMTATRNTLYQRFIFSKNRKPEEFEQIWNDWCEIEEPFWQRCADQFIDTSLITTSNTN